MAQDNPYYYIIVESYVVGKGSGLRGDVHIRPVQGERFSQGLHVECSRTLIKNYPVGTKFKIKVKLTDNEGQGEYLYSHYNWKYEVVS